jgi:flagellar basal-body rod protein FlgC
MASPVTGGNPTEAARSLMPTLETSVRGMSLQQRFLEIIARNIANANTTRTAEGGPYRRQIGVARGGAGGPGAEVSEDPQPGRMVYDPGHPDANEAGFVEYPNVDTETEIVDLMVARRAFEANASVFEAAKNMLKRALEI